MSRPRLLDLFCGAGGAAKGYHNVGFDVVGVDINPQPRYPFEFIQADALEYVNKHGSKFDAIHASPPCQRYSVANRGLKTHHKFPDLLPATREAVLAQGKPFSIENVPGLSCHRYCWFHRVSTQRALASASMATVRTLITGKSSVAI